MNENATDEAQGWDKTAGATSGQSGTWKVPQGYLNAISFLLSEAVILGDRWINKELGIEQ